MRHAGGRFRGASSDQSGISTDVNGLNTDRAGTEADRSGQSFETRSDIIPIADNPDVWLRRFKRVRGMTKLKRLIAKLRRAFRFVLSILGDLVSPKYSMGEKIEVIKSMTPMDGERHEQHERESEEHRLFRFHREQARILEQRVIDILTNLGFCFAVTKDDRKYIKKRIKIKRVDVSPFAYVYHINETPYGVKKTDMSQDWVATELASSLGHKVRHELDLNGLRYTVEVGGMLSVPNFVTFKDFDSMPKNMPPLAFFAGLTTNGSPVYRNLADAPHMIVAGQTGGGKSNLLNGIICGLISRQTATVVKIILFDLKGGIEFDSFKGVPHLWGFEEDQDGIIEYPEAIITALKAIHKECVRRMALLKKAKVRNIGEYNRGKHPKNRIPYIVGVFDEYTTARKLAGAEVETLLSTIANISRAAGIHFIIGTQYPKSEILSTLISVNFPWRIAFNMTPAASLSVLGSWDASGLTPVGRAILQLPDGQLFIQTPRITNSTITNVVNAAKSGATDIAVNTVDIEEIIEWAMNNTGGKLERDAIFNHFNERISKHQLTDLFKSITENGKTFDVSGNLYRIVQPANPAMARYVELVDGRDVSDEQRATTEEDVTRDEKVTV